MTEKLCEGDEGLACSVDGDDAVEGHPEDGCSLQPVGCGDGVEPGSQAVEEDAVEVHVVLPLWRVVGFPPHT